MPHLQPRRPLRRQRRRLPPVSPPLPPGNGAGGVPAPGPGQGPRGSRPFGPASADPLVIVADSELKWGEFRTDAAKLVTQLFKGNYPNYQNLIPEDWTTRVTFPRTGLQMHVNAAARLVLRDNSILRFNVEGENSVLRVRAQSADAGDAVGEMTAAVEGADNRIAFNAKYVQEILSRVDVDQIAMAFKDGSSPGVFRPRGPERRLCPRNHAHVRPVGGAGQAGGTEQYSPRRQIRLRQQRAGPAGKGR